MSTTFAAQVAKVRQQVLGFSRNQEQISYLTAPMGASDTTFTVDTDTVDELSSGIVEIDEELIWVKKYDRSSGIATILAGVNGRGYDGTTPVSHLVNTLVTSNPQYPLGAVKQAIVDTIQSLYPDLYVMATTTLTKSAPQYEYVLPADVSEVWKVNADTVGPSQLNFACRNWRFNPQANTDRFPTGKSLQVFDDITPGRKIWVSYQKEPGTPVSDTDDMGTVTGFGADYDRYTDMVTYGTCGKLLAAVEPPRLQQGSVESAIQSQVVPTGSALRTSQYYFDLFERSLAAERRRLQERYDTYSRFGGGN